jgi:hypothetical protein
MPMISRLRRLPMTVRRTAILAMTALICTTPLAAMKAHATPVTYYVAKTGSDTNPGTLTLPWHTIQHAANVVGAGTVVYVRAGVYNEQVKINVSGTTAAPITFQAYPGEAAIVDGTGISPGSESGLVDIENRSNLIVKGLQIRNFKSSSSAQDPVGIYVVGACSGIQLIGNKVYNITTTVKSSSGDALGIAIYGTNSTTPISNVIISGNELTALVTGYSESLAVSGNVTNFLIANNLIHDNNNIGIDIAGFEGTASNASVDQARGGTISGNVVYNITSLHNPAYGGELGADGIYVDGGTNVVIERNLVHNCDIGIEMASEHKGRVTSYVTARSNVVYASNMVGITIGGYANNVGGTDHCIAVNNSLLNNDTAQTGSGEFQIQYHATNNIFENNIVYANNQALFVNSFANNAVSPAVIDHNQYFTTAGAGNTNWVWNNNSLTGNVQWGNITGNDKHSIFADPKFVSLTIPNLALSSGSPAINSGINLGTSIEGTLNYPGSPRLNGTSIDIGAY